MFQPGSFPRQVRRMDASPKPTRGTTRASNGCEDNAPKLRGIMGCGTSSVFVDLCPYEFCRVELWSSGRKLIDMQTRMMCDKIFHLGTAMDRMFVPDKDERSSDGLQQMCEKTNDFLASDRFAIGLQVQFDLMSSRCHSDAANQI